MRKGFSVKTKTQILRGIMSPIFSAKLGLTRYNTRFLVSSIANFEKKNNFRIVFAQKFQHNKEERVMCCVRFKDVDFYFILKIEIYYSTYGI